MQMNDRQTTPSPLVAALRDLARHDRQRGASAAVEERLLAEVSRLGRVRRRRQMSAGLTVAAAVFLGVVALDRLDRSGREVMRGDRGGSSPAESSLTEPATPAAEVTTEFFPLPYSSIPATDTHTIRMEVPRTALATFGVADFAAQPTVLADVVVGTDGLARAVRFVRAARVSNPEEQKP
jgi:hypothetical protein